MDGIKSEPDLVLMPEEMPLAERRSRLDQVLSNLEHNSAILEGLELTLAVALLDHAIAEVRRNKAV
jgi:hypothetical protein